MIFRSKCKFPVSNWKNLFKGEVAFILGNGPSLLENDLSLIDHFFTIGMNRSYKALLPKILIWQDESLYEDCYEDLKTLPCAKVTTKEIDKDDIFSHFVINKSKFMFSGDPYYLYGGGCTSVLAIQMAVSMGFSSIVLLGCDCCYRGEQTDFYGLNKNHNSNTLMHFNNAMQWVKNNCPVDIHNCSDNNFWEKENLNEILNKQKLKKRNHLFWLNALFNGEKPI